MDIGAKNDTATRPTQYQMSDVKSICRYCSSLVLFESETFVIFGDKRPAHMKCYEKATQRHDWLAPFLEAL
jgi:hypothetical protein